MEKKFYVDFLRASAVEQESILCFGMDPMLQKIPKSIAGDPEERIFEFFSSIISSSLEAGAGLGAVKPNYAYFAQYGFDGLRALAHLIEFAKEKEIPVILDAKRGDIDTSSEAYAREIFEFWNADSVTLSPYMGYDSLHAFLQYPGRGAYVLVRTSNKSAEDLQSLECGIKQKPLFLEVARKVVSWHKSGLGAVVGATDLDDFEAVLWVFADSNAKVPLLVPGVGRQGGSAKQIANILRIVDSGSFPIQRINSSSGISFAYEKTGAEDYIGAAVAEIKKLNAEIGFK
jgi:orotidine-5'-phosphate decarboxylase